MPRCDRPTVAALSKPSPSRRRARAARRSRVSGARAGFACLTEPPSRHRALFKRLRARFARGLARGEADEKESFTLELADIAMSLSQRGVNVLTPRSESA